MNFPPRKRKGENASPRFPIRIYVRDAIIKKEKHEIGKYLREIGKKKTEKSLMAIKNGHLINKIYGPLKKTPGIFFKRYSHNILKNGRLRF